MERIFTTIECAGAREMEQPKVGPKGEGAGATESKGTEEAFWAFLQERWFSAPHRCVCGSRPGADQHLLARRMHNVGTASFASRMARRA
jgi:hypothetical protein